MTDRLGDGPIETSYLEIMNALAEAIDEALNGKVRAIHKRTGFVMLVFPFDGHEGRCNYISNASRQDVVVLLREQIRRFEGAPDVTGNA